MSSSIGGTCECLIFHTPVQFIIGHIHRRFWFQEMHAYMGRIDIPKASAVEVSHQGTKAQNSAIFYYIFTSKRVYDFPSYVQ